MFRHRTSLWSLVATLLVTAACSKDPEVAKREHLKRGDDYFAQKQYREAIIEYRNAVQADPRYGAARFQLAHAYIAVSEPHNALREYVRAADLMPENVEAQMKAGELLLLSRRFEDAKSRAEKALSVAPASIEAQILKANALAGLRNVDEAIGQVEHAIEKDPARALSYASLGALQLAKGDRQAAEASYRKAVEADPRSLPALISLGNFYLLTNRAAEAEQALTKALTLEPRSLLANRALAGMYMSTGRLSAAEAPLKVIAEDMAGPDGRIALAEYYLQMKRTADAKQVLQRAATMPDGFAASTVKLAQIAADEARPAEAYELLEAVLAKESRNADALSLKAQLQLSERKLDEATATVSSAINTGAATAAIHLVRGRILSAQNDTDGAVAAYKEVLRLSPGKAPARFDANLELARISLARQKPQETIDYATGALQVYSGHPEARLLLARANILKGDAPAAELALKQLDSQFPGTPAVQSELARLYLDRDPKRARELFTQALARDRMQITAIQGLIALDIQEKRESDARARIESALASAPRNIPVRLLAARTYALLKDPSSAERALKQAIEIDPNYLPAYGPLVQMYASQRRLPEATAELERLVQKQPAAVGTRTALGMLLQTQNRAAEARVHYQKALELNPRAGVAANNLAWMMAEEGTDLESALQLAQTAKAELPDNPEVADTLGWIYHKKGLNTLAVVAFEQSVTKDPKNATYHYHLGLAYAGAGDPVKAKQALQRALSLKLAPEQATEATKALVALPG